VATTLTPVGPPIFTQEGPDFYDQAHAHNSPFATAGPYLTVLTGPQETDYRAWVTANNVPTDPDEDPSDYDMRGFYVASMIDNTVPDWTGPPAHFPDTWKTPYDTSFSAESQYATASCPFHWVTDPEWGDLLLDGRNGQIVFSENPRAGVTRPKPSSSAAEKLTPFQPSDGLEALGHDIDLTELTLAFRSQASLSVIQMLTDGSLTRTIEGASTLTLTLHDRDNVIRLSGLLNKKTAVKIDGLWFRLVQVDVQGYDVQMSFEDREVAVLREFPPADAPHDGFKAVSVKKTTRVKFAKGLVDDPGRVGVLDIGFQTGPSGAPKQPITTSADRPSSAAKSQTATPGLPKGKVKVQLLPATETQRAYLERVLDVGYSMDAPEDVLVMAVMTVAVESRAGSQMVGIGKCSGPCASSPNALGIFQQCPGCGSPGLGSRPGIAWPASNDVEKDSHAWFTVAKYAYGKYGKTSSLPWICSWIQRDFTWSSAHPGSEVAKWEQEARTTVRYYLGTEVAPPKLPRPGSQDEIVVPPFDPGAGEPDTAQMFTRGTRTTRGTRKTFKRESNWDALQRLADEVRWRCFCVSGTVWFITEKDLFAAKPWMTVSPDTPGVDSIDGNYDIGKHNAVVTIACRIDMWETAPGRVVMLDGTAIFDGRWIVTSIERSLFSPAAKITLKKPRPALPESLAPEYGSSQSSGTSDVTLPRAKKGTGSCADDPVACAYAAAKAIHAKRIPYVWGGGHRSAGSPDHGVSGHADSAGTIPVAAPGYDCSGAVGAVLAAAGMGYAIGDSVPDSGHMASDWGSPGEGKEMTVWANSNHVFIVFRVADKEPAQGHYSVMIQAGHDTGGHPDQPYGHEGESGASGEQAFTQDIRQRVLALLDSDPNFTGVSGDAWSASAGATASTVDDETWSGDLFLSIHYDVGTPGSGYFFGYTRGAVDDRPVPMSTRSAAAANSIADALNTISGHPLRLDDNSQFGASPGDPPGSTGWGYYAWGSSQRSQPEDRVNYLAGTSAALILECGRGGDSTYLAKRDEIARSIYRGICNYFGTSAARTVPHVAEHFGTGYGGKSWDGPGFNPVMHTTGGFVPRHWKDT
jgi:hypothetical protein